MPTNIQNGVFVIVLLFGLLSCSKKSNKYDYIKILSIAKADTVTDLNKGLKLYNYLYYNPKKDSAVFRFVQSVDPDIFNTYQGSFRNKEYADTIALLIELLRHHDNGYLPYKGNMDAGYSGPHLYIEYSDSKGMHYNAFAVDNDTLSNFSEFFHRLENLPWKKVLINNEKVDETDDVVKILKGLGTYDSMVKPYVPLQCATGIELDKLYGTWRTIGDKYNDATFKYWVYEIDSSGEWIINRVDSSKTSQYYKGKITSIRNQIIKIESKHGLTTLEILNLTDNCFEFRHKASKQIWRLDRMK